MERSILGSWIMLLSVIELLVFNQTLADTKGVNSSDVAMTTEEKDAPAFQRRQYYPKQSNCDQLTGSKTETVAMDTTYDRVSMAMPGQQPSNGSPCRNEDQGHHKSLSVSNDSSWNSVNDDNRDKHNNDDNDYDDDDDDDDDEDETLIVLPPKASMDHSEYPLTATDNDNLNDYRYFNSGNYDDGDDDGQENQERMEINGKERMEYDGKLELERSDNGEEEYEKEEKTGGGGGGEEEEEEEDGKDGKETGYNPERHGMITDIMKEDLNSTTAAEPNYVDVNFDYYYRQDSYDSQQVSSAVAAEANDEPIPDFPSTKEVVFGTSQGRIHHVFSLAWLEDENLDGNFTVFICIIAVLVLIAIATAIFRYRQFVSSLVDCKRIGYRRRDGSHEAVSEIHEESNNLLAHVQV